MKETKSRQVNVLIDPPEFAILERMEAATGLPKVSILRSAVYALIRDYQRKGYVTFPLRVVSAGSETEEIAIQAATAATGTTRKASAKRGAK